MKRDKKKPVCLIIRDGWGRGKPTEDNAIYNANTKYTDYYEKNYPTTLISTSGLSVGLPSGYQGNSEVGHMNIGAGRVVYQSLTRIDKSIDDGDFFKNSEIVNAFDEAEKRGSRIHLIGLVQEEGVHAVTRHCVAFLKIAKERNFNDIVIHAITDGRDTPPRSAIEHLSLLQKKMDELNTGKIVTLIGRYYAMDRDNRWNRTEIAYNAVMFGKGKVVDSWMDGVRSAYEEDESDEFIRPRIIDYDGAGKGDIFIFFNFRFDRTRQLTKAIVEDDFKEFPREKNNIYLLAMTHYYDNGNFKEVFGELKYTNILGEVISLKGLKQLRISETEKYAHVTFFFNALRNEPFDNEERILVNSPKVATYDLKPEMSANIVKEKLLEAIRSERYDLIVCNFANCDMVGHTGVYDKIITAVETVDKCTNEVVKEILKYGGVTILTADHGNAEQTKFDDGSPMTSHTKNPVPLTIVGLDDNRLILRKDGSLCDISPTILEIMDIKKPEEMSCSSLIIRSGNS